MRPDTSSDRSAGTNRRGTRAGNIATLRTILGAVFALLFSTSAHAGNGIASLSYKMEPGNYSLGARCFVTGDADTNAVGRIFFRAYGSGVPYDSGMVLIRRVGTTVQCGRILHLTPATQIQFYFEFIDPTSGTTTTTADTLSTRGWLPPPTSGTTYYVNSNTGNDVANNGLDAAHPVVTIGKALSLLSAQTAGTVVLMGPGEWHEANRLNFGSPTLGSRYAIVGDGSNPDSIIIDGSYGPAARNGYVDNTHAVSWSSMGVDSIYRCYYPHGDSCTAVVLNYGEWLHPKTSMYELMHDAGGESSGFWWQNDTLYARRVGGTSPAGTILHAGYYDNLLRVERRWWCLSGFTMRYAGGVGNGVPILLGQWTSGDAASNCHLSNLRIYGCAGRAIYGTEYSDSVVVDSCTTSGLTIGAMPYEASKSRLQENSNVILVSGKAWTVAYNTCVQAFDEVDQGGVGAPDTTASCDYEVVHNTFKAYQDDACELDNGLGTNGLFGWNACSSGGSMVSIAPLWQGPAFVVYNQGWDLAKEGIKLGKSSNGEALVAHNSVATNNAAGAAVWNTGEYHKRTHFRNNIFRAGTNASALVYTTSNDTAGVYTNDFNADLYDSTAGGSRLMTWVTGTSYSIPNMRTARGWEMNGLAAPAGYTNVASGDLSLSAGSAALNVGLSIPGVNTPALGQLHSAGSAPDIGACEAADVIAPGTVSDLSVPSIGHTTLLVEWTAPGDDGGVGTASEYDLRRSATTITSGNFLSATRLSTTTPNPAGSSECVAATGLSGSHTYCFALKTKDVAGNWSALSNVPSATTHSSGTEVDCSGGERARPAPGGGDDGGHSSIEDVPSVMGLDLPLPNPARAAVALRYAIPREGEGKRFEVAVYDVSGRHTFTMAQGVGRPGRFGLQWNLQNTDGMGVASGVYFLRFRLGSAQLVRRIAVLR